MTELDVFVVRKFRRRRNALDDDAQLTVTRVQQERSERSYDVSFTFSMTSSKYVTIMVRLDLEIHHDLRQCVYVVDLLVLLGANFVPRAKPFNPVIHPR